MDNCVCAHNYDQQYLVVALQIVKVTWFVVQRSTMNLPAIRYPPLAITSTRQIKVSESLYEALILVRKGFSIGFLSR